MSNSNSDHTSKAAIDQCPTPRPAAAAQKKGCPDEALKGDTRVDIATADDINVDEDNAIGSPKNSLTATEPNNTEDRTVVTGPIKNPGDEVTPGTAQTGKVPCECCGGAGQLGGESCTQCGGTGEVVVNVGDA